MLLFSRDSAFVERAHAAMRVYGLIFFLLASGAHLTHRALDATPLPQPQSLNATLPSVGALQLLGLGYDSLVADYYWLRALGHFGDTQMHALVYPDLEPLLRRTVMLDPNFEAAYYLAGTALTLQGMDVSLANALLEHGLEHRPDVWKIPYYLGFNLYYFAHDYARAAELLARAAKHPEAPAVAGQLATRLAAHAGRPEVGLAYVDSMLEGLTDEKLRQEYLERRKLLLLEIELANLGEAARRYREQHGGPPRTIDELVGPGLLREVPIDPFGDPYYLDAEGTVRTRSEDRRLRLKPAALGQKPGGPWR